MTGTINKWLLFVSAATLLLAVTLFALFDQAYFLLLPFVLVGGLLIWHNVEWLIYLLVITIPWSIEYNFTPSLGTDLPDEPLMLVTALAGIILLITYRRQWMQRRWAHPLLVLLALQFVWSVFTVAASTDPLLSFKYLLAKAWYLLAFVVVPLFCFRDEAVLRRTARLLVASMSAFVLLALYRHSHYGWSFEKINTALEPFFRNHVNYSALLVCTVPIIIAALQLVHLPPYKRGFQLLLLIIVAALYFSYARGAWLALIAGVVAYWLIRKRLLLWAYIAFITITAGGIAFLSTNDRHLMFANDYQQTIFHTDFREHLVATYQFRDVSTAERFHRWVAGVRMIEDSWVKGFGPSTFNRNYKSYTQPAFKTWVSKNEEQSTVHHYFLLMIIEQGLVGLLLFVLLVGLLFYSLQRSYHRTGDPFWKAATAATGAILLMQCVLNSLSDLIETDKVGSIFYLCVAVTVIGAWKSGSVIEESGKDRA